MFCVLICSTGCFFLKSTLKKITKRIYFVSDNMLNSKSTPTLYTFYLGGGTHQIKNNIQHVKAGKCLNCHWESNELHFYQSDGLAGWKTVCKDSLHTFCMRRIWWLHLIATPCGWKSAPSCASVVTDANVLSWRERLRGPVGWSWRSDRSSSSRGVESAVLRQRHLCAHRLLTEPLIRPPDHAASMRRFGVWPYCGRLWLLQESRASQPASRPAGLGDLGALPSDGSI